MSYCDVLSCVVDSPVPEFTLVTRRRHADRAGDPPRSPSADPAPEQRYIPGMTPRPRPARPVQPIAPADSPEPAPADQSARPAPVTSPLQAFPALGDEVISSSASVSSSLSW